MSGRKVYLDFEAKANAIKMVLKIQAPELHSTLKDYKNA